MIWPKFAFICLLLLHFYVEWLFDLDIFAPPSTCIHVTSLSLSLPLSPPLSPPLTPSPPSLSSWWSSTLQRCCGLMNLAILMLSSGAYSLLMEEKSFPVASGFTKCVCVCAHVCMCVYVWMLKYNNNCNNENDNNWWHRPTRQSFLEVVGGAACWTWQFAIFSGHGMVSNPLVLCHRPMCSHVHPRILFFLP